MHKSLALFTPGTKIREEFVLFRPLPEVIKSLQPDVTHCGFNAEHVKYVKSSQSLFI